MSPAGAVRYKVLLADDDREILGVLRLLFARAGHTVFLAASGREALLSAVDSRPDIVICDVQMPDIDGLECCSRLRADPRTARIPVVLMSGASKETQGQLEGFSSGADDYVLKPFDPRILLAKTEAVLRRYATAAELTEFLEAAGATIDVTLRTVAVGGRVISLTRKEFDLLVILFRKRNRILSPQFLLEAVWGQDLAERNDPHTVRVHLSSLRRKLGAGLARRIVTVTGRGYRLEA